MFLVWLSLPHQALRPRVLPGVRISCNRIDFCTDTCIIRLTGMKDKALLFTARMVALHDILRYLHNDKIHSSRRTEPSKFAVTLRMLMQHS